MARVSRLQPGTHCVLPMAPVERIFPDSPNIHAIEATHFDADAIRCGPRRIERMHAAVLAEGMLGDARAELVSGDRILGAQQLEPFARHDKVQEALLRADRAVALRHVRQVALATESYFAAMAAALISL